MRSAMVEEDFKWKKDLSAMVLQKDPLFIAKFSAIQFLRIAAGVQAVREPW